MCRRALAAIGAPRATTRQTAWNHAGHHTPVGADHRVVIDLDTLITAHSDKENAAATFKKGFGFHPLAAFVDHGPTGTGEGLAALLRPGNAGSTTAEDHIAVAAQALARLPHPHRRHCRDAPSGRSHPASSRWQTD